MTYSETLDYLYQQLPMYQRIGQAAYKADLSSTVALMSHLGNPENQFKSIHVAGTNGKGSVSHLLSSIFQEAGYKTGLYTSPHLVDFRERVRINGEMIPENKVVEFVSKHKATLDSLKLSFFEWTVGLAFDYFEQEKVDIAIVEVGMGGRLDSTNVITPELSIITNIGSDHSQFLGDSPGKIAKEKAGVIKKNRPVIIGRSQRETEGIFRKIALDRDSPITFADQQFPDDIPLSPLQGQYQKENFQTVVISCEKLSQLGWNMDSNQIQKGFGNVLINTGLRGRWELIQDKPKLICDVAHNVEGLGIVFEQLKTTPYHDLHIVLGFVNDKNVRDILELVPNDAKLYLCEPDIPRAMPVSRLVQIATEVDLKFSSHPNVNEATSAARSAAISDDLIFVGGSTFVVADLLKQ
ncbi:bifunctional folylpolyglutamate synthase/dihydrofolate synthase [bacterium]|nr:bifunctional folylpolyglutamate synthase/dihydrofolate synthase [bacterium]MDC1221352.1 bifunctional folylpolyglutamate synthase/dihydrofolate synthase [Salibacteraceae bacterium]